MVPSWLLGVLLAVFGVLTAAAFYFLSQKQLHHALWSGFFSVVLLLFVIAMHLRNHIILAELRDALKPIIKVGLIPDDMPSVNPFRYPLQEYHLSIHKEDENSVPAQELTIRFFFPNVVSQASGHGYVRAGEKVSIFGLYRYEKDKNGITVTKEVPAESSLTKSMSLSVQKWRQGDELVNSNIVVFSCDKWPEKGGFAGSIVIDLSKKPKIVKSPGEIGTYTGEYYYEIKGEKFPPIKITGAILEPDVEKKRAEHHYDLGMELMKKDVCDQAITEFTTAISLNPKHDDAYFKRGYCYGNLGKYDKAIMDFDTLVEISPKYAKAYFYRAVAKKNRGDSDEEVEKDFRKACGLGFKKGCKEYWSLKFSTVNPKDGWFAFTHRKEDWLEPNNEFIEIIPHVSKEEFEIHIYRDKDNVLKALISNTFSKKVILKYENLERLKDAPNHPEHEIKMTWYKGENKLYINGVLVDVYPKDVDSSLTQLEEGICKVGKSDSDVFRALSAIGPDKGRIGFSISKEDWLENNGQFISIVPHIFISEQNFEVHGYRDRDYVFRFLISTSYSKNVILEFSDLGRLKEHPEHPKHFIQVAWDNEKKELYVNEGGPVDAYP